MNTTTPIPAPLSETEIAAISHAETFPGDLVPRLLATLTAKDEMIARLTMERDAAQKLLHHIHNEVAALEDFDAESVMDEIKQTLAGTRVFDDAAYAAARAETAESRVKVLEANQRTPGFRERCPDCNLEPDDLKEGYSCDIAVSGGYMIPRDHCPVRASISPPTQVTEKEGT